MQPDEKHNTYSSGVTPSHLWVGVVCLERQHLCPASFGLFWYKVLYDFRTKISPTEPKLTALTKRVLVSPSRRPGRGCVYMFACIIFRHCHPLGCILGQGRGLRGCCCAHLCHLVVVQVHDASKSPDFWPGQVPSVLIVISPRNCHSTSLSHTLLSVSLSVVVCVG